jgi:hypothetical protein
MFTLPSFPVTGFDIECRPLPDLVDKFTKPFPPFDEAEVKCGNMVDPQKIAAKIAQARTEHYEELAKYWSNAYDRAALNPFTGEIIVIGLIDEHGSTAYLDGPEKGILVAFWTAYALGGDTARKWVYWSGCGDFSKKFDIDYIVTRSRIRGVRIPPGVRLGRNYSSRIVDLAGEFLLHQREAYLSLTKAGELFGLYGEHGTGPEGAPADLHVFPKREGDPVQGANFFQFWSGTAYSDVPQEEQRLLALRYLGNDLKHLLHLAPRILA